MKTLLILRHAKSSWREPDIPDHDRPLNKRGKQDAPRMGELLAETGLLPEWIVTSTAKRARKTAGKVAAACGYQGDITEEPRLYMSGAETYVEVLRAGGGDRSPVLIVGHNPDLESLLELLTGQQVPLGTAALARVELPIEVWRELQANRTGRLIAVWHPKELPGA